MELERKFWTRGPFGPGSLTRILVHEEMMYCPVAKGYHLKIRSLVKSAYQKICFSYFSTETYVVGTQKNRLNETVLLSTQNIY